MYASWLMRTRFPRSDVEGIHRFVLLPCLCAALEKIGSSMKMEGEALGDES